MPFIYLISPILFLFLNLNFVNVKINEKNILFQNNKPISVVGFSRFDMIFVEFSEPVVKMTLVIRVLSKVVLGYPPMWKSQIYIHYSFLTFICQQHILSTHSNVHSVHKWKQLGGIMLVIIIYSFNKNHYPLMKYCIFILLSLLF